MGNSRLVTVGTEWVNKYIDRYIKQVKEAQEVQKKSTEAIKENVKEQKKQEKSLDDSLKVFDKYVNSWRSLNRAIKSASEKNLLTKPLAQASKGFGYFLNDIQDAIRGTRGVLQGLSVKNFDDLFRSIPTRFREIISDVQNFRNTLVNTFPRLEPIIRGVELAFIRFSIQGRYALQGIRENLTGLFNNLKNFNLGSIKSTFSQLGSLLSGGISTGIASLQSALAAVMAPLAGFVSTLAGALLPLLAPLAAGLVALGVAFFGIKQALATVNVEPVTQSFNNLVSTIPRGNQLLSDLQTAAGGTIDKFNLLKTANISLAGATGQLKQELGIALPKLLEIARVQARATGQSVDHLFTSLVTGVKRSSPLLIDNTGLIIKVGEANAAYAESVGKSVDALSGQERQLALLQATLKGGAAAIAGAGGIIVTNAERLAEIKTIFKDLGNDFGVAFQPLLEIILRSILPALRFFAENMRNLINIARAFNDVFLEIYNLISLLLFPLSAVGAVFQTVFNYVSNTVIGTLDLLAKAIRFQITILQIILSPLTILFNTFGHIVGRIRELIEVFNYLGSIMSSRFNFIGKAASYISTVFDQLQQNIFTFVDNAILGFTAWIGAMINGFAQGVLQILKLVAFLTNTIGDFLIGQSPPPKGALSNIDVGGANVMKAWLEGFTGVSLDPVKQVTAQVTELLGEIATFTREQVATRLAMLDAALLPFQQRVDALKGQLESLKTPIDEAISSLETQQDKLIEKFNAGDFALAAQIKAIDEQKDQINSLYDAEQARLAQAEYQLALKQAEQAEERALLGIQQQRLGTEQLINNYVSATVNASSKAKKEKQKTGETPVGGLSDAELTPEQAKLQGLSDFQKEALSNIVQPSVDSGVFNEIGAQASRIGEGSSKIGAGLANLPNRLTEPFVNAFSEIGNFAEKIPNAIRSAISKLEIGDTLRAQLFVPFQTVWNDIQSGFDTVKEYIQGIWNDLPEFPDLKLPNWLTGGNSGEKGSKTATTPPIYTLLKTIQKGWQETKDFFSQPITLPIWLTASIDELFPNGISLITVLEDITNAWVDFTFPTLTIPDLDFSEITIPDLDFTSLITNFEINSALAVAALQPLKDFFGTAIVEGSLLWVITQFVSNLFTLRENSIIPNFTFLTQSLIGVGSPLGLLISFFAVDNPEGLFITLQNLFNNISNIVFYEAINSFIEFYNQIASAEGIFGKLESALSAVFLLPIQTTVNIAMGLLEGLLGAAVNAINGFFAEIRNFASGLPFLFPGAQIAKNFANSLQDLTAPTLPRLSLVGGAKGGLFSSGAMVVGERGREVVSAATKQAVFPNQFVVATERLTDVMTELVNLPVMQQGSFGTSSTYNNSSSVVNVNANQMDMVTLNQVRNLARSRG